jgi:hypothetical protein
MSDDAITDAHEADALASCIRADAGTCKTGPTVVSCWHDNQGQVCLDTSCGDFADASCTNECAADEYGVSCLLNGTDAPPPDACHLVVGLPNGSAFYCCPCE